MGLLCLFRQRQMFSNSPFHNEVQPCVGNLFNWGRKEEEGEEEKEEKQRVDVPDIQTLTLLSEPERRGRHLAVPYKE